jgi:hypothetical protein
MGHRNTVAFESDGMGKYAWRPPQERQIAHTVGEYPVLFADAMADARLLRNG